MKHHDHQQFTPEQQAAAKNDPIMVDLETLGTGPNSVIIAVGAVKFNYETDEITDIFYEVVSRESCVAIGLEIDQSTVDWWAKQSVEARAAFNEPGQDIKVSLIRFSDFANSNSLVYGNGSDFDNVLLANAYKKCGMEIPWKFYNNRCYRTMKNFYPRVTMKREGVHHNAAHDAIFQAKHMMAILRKHHAKG